MNESISDQSESSEDLQNDLEATYMLNVRNRLVELLAYFLSQFVNQETELLARVRRIEFTIGRMIHLEEAIEKYQDKQSLG